MEKPEQNPLYHFCFADLYALQKNLNEKLSNILNNDDESQFAHFATERMELLDTLGEVKKEIGNRIHQIVKEFQTKKAQNKNLQKKTEDLDLSVRAYNTLKAMRINSVAELVERSVRDLKGQRNCGKATVKEIQALIEEMGLKLKQ